MIAPNDANCTYRDGWGRRGWDFPGSRSEFVAVRCFDDATDDFLTVEDERVLFFLVEGFLFDVLEVRAMVGRDANCV